ncbi:alpha-amylase family glycosyl hydrolase [Knoellia subterranea]|uniref:Alpha-1,6-glucosidase n=1 Tax=Knoellia subterranea KCTC 19937 TaxID=1385521 RepID=A0A0A0JS34_9MICO|nr:alpha-amylase family glycosyl hydrolase [Knoellia subterranea]KGN39489.1 alpha-1,6-glucosidase [Knoellia subterranea KCTC 19937]
MPRHTRRLYAVAAAAALAAAPLVGAVAPAAAETESVALVGSLQSELGCPADWQPDCSATELTRVGDSTAYTKVFSLPAGSYEFKVALNDSWDENYGAGGAFDGANIPLVLEGPATLEFTYDDVSHLVSFTPQGVGGGTTPADAPLAKDSLRSPLTRERFYFLMADRFANGRTDNDTGGLTGGRLQTGFDPTDKAFYHGGDLAGVTRKLDYIKGLGTTAIWLTPSFKNKPVQGKPGEESAGYHGYWITDFTQIDPHLGTNEEMKALIAAAHKKGMKVFFDIITNHTADVIDYREGTYTYKSKKSSPYEDASGATFDDRDFVNTTFPEMDPATSFPYTPFFHEGDEDAKTPAWLNDPLMYHNRGDSTFAGESSTYGDFIGLDDLFTERPEVVDGMGDIYKQWVDFGIDGFRIDTVKHVNLEFWQKFMPDLLEHAATKNDDFFAFGEVYDGNPAVMSEYTTRGKLQATLDFGFQQQGVDFAKGKPANVLADFFGKDDWYTDADSNAYQLPTFLGNHDMGRVAMFLKEGTSSEAEHLARVKFAESLMFATRGNPVTYYGDEQGFIGTGGDQLAREDMFASKVDIYNGEDVLAGPEGSRDRYATDHPLYQHIRALSNVRAKHPALADGAQVQRFAAEDAGIFAVSRIDAGQKVEYVVAANNATTPSTATFPTWTRGKGAVFTPVSGTDTAVKPAADGSVKVTVPPLTVSVWRANKPIATDGAAPTVSVSTGAANTVAGRAEVSADVSASTFAQTTFLYRPVGTTQWRTIGTDDNAPFRVFHDVAGMPLGSLLEYRAVVRDAAGRVAADGTWASVVTDAPPPAEAEIGDSPETQPGAVAVAGTHNSEMGCPADWEPWCDNAQLALDAKDKIWKKSFDLPAGPYSYKAALDRAWTENYGEKGVRDGANISYETDGSVTFYYDPTTHWATSDEETTIVTVPGSFQSELGCPSDFAPDCMRPWLQDKDGDGIFSWATTKIPAGTWTFKVAHGLSWDENYGDGGAANGANMTVTVPSDGARTTFNYNSSTHVTTVSSQ